MTDRTQDTDPYSMALGSLRTAVANLRETEEWGDLKWLPADFPDRLLELAWRHRVDPNSGSFAREVKAYITSLAPDAEAE